MLAKSTLWTSLTLIALSACSGGGGGGGSTSPAETFKQETALSTGDLIDITNGIEIGMTTAELVHVAYDSSGALPSLQSGSCPKIDTDDSNLDGDIDEVDVNFQDCFDEDNDTFIDGQLNSDLETEELFIDGLIDEEEECEIGATAAQIKYAEDTSGLLTFTPADGGNPVNVFISNEVFALPDGTFLLQADYVTGQFITEDGLEAVVVATACLKFSADLDVLSGDILTLLIDPATDDLISSIVFTPVTNDLWNFTVSDAFGNATGSSGNINVDEESIGF